MGDKEKVGILLIHGFTGNLKTLSYLKTQFENSGFIIEMPSLSGHNTDYRDLDKVKFEDWLDDVETAFKRLKEKTGTIFVLGLSMGGALALHLQANFKDIKGVILVNHALTLKKSLKLFFVPILRHFVKFIYDPGSDIKDKSKTGLAYDYISLNALYEFMKLMKVIRSELANVTSPLLIFKSLEDHVIPYESVIITLKGVNSDEIILIHLKNSYHVATEDFDKEVIFNRSIEFIKTLLKEERWRIDLTQ
ncbi:alpha/beta hydrolase [Caldisericum exile]|uniref:Esterase n=1 Tax=Caldisericum exile (strain DSM 21853 / NBRC 104410 / AZM16c01) TaxID=511051 RepID=A0A7U6GFX8_CALEA|nr:alpha/beta fold hydrolase [Caldisericum exile]BAL81677.1 putative esterase [Caldisericum exile AZM16c01]